MQALIVIIVALAVTVVVLWFFFAPRKAFRARVDNGVQEAVVEVKGGYSPAVIEAEAGLPLRLIFDRKEDGECSSHVVFSDFGVDLALPPFRTTTLTIHPDRPGEYGFACGMNMLHGTLRVLPGKHHAAMQDEYSTSKKIRIMQNLMFLCNRNRLRLMKHRMNPLILLLIFLLFLLILQMILPHLVKCGHWLRGLLCLPSLRFRYSLLRC